MGIISVVNYNNSDHFLSLFFAAIRMSLSNPVLQYRAVGYLSILSELLQVLGQIGLHVVIALD